MQGSKGDVFIIMKASMREWSPVSLALSCVLASIALCLHADNILMYTLGAASATIPFVCSFLMGIIVLCLSSSVSAHDDEKRRWSIVVGLATALAGSLLALFLEVLPVVPTAVMSGLLLGFGLACLLRQWGRFYRSFSFQGALLNTGLAFLLASIWWMAMANAGSVFLFCLGLIVLALSGGLPLLASDIVRADEVREGFRSDDLWVSSVTIWQVMRQGWAAVAGLMLNFFAIGLTFWQINGASAGIVPKPLAYAVVAVVVWWVALHARTAIDGLLGAFYRVALPLAAVIMLVPPLLVLVFPGIGGGKLVLVPYLGTALCNVLGLVVLFWSAKSSEVGFSKMFAAFCASCAASVAVGLVACQVFGVHAPTVLLCLITSYLIAMVLNEVKRSFVRRKSSAISALTADEQLDVAATDL